MLEAIKLRRKERKELQKVMDAYVKSNGNPTEFEKNLGTISAEKGWQWIKWSKGHLDFLKETLKVETVTVYVGAVLFMVWAILIFLSWGTETPINLLIYFAFLYVYLGNMLGVFMGRKFIRLLEKENGGSTR